MQNENTRPAEATYRRPPLLEAMLILAKHKIALIGFAALFAVLAGGLALLLPNQYSATLKIAPSRYAQVFNWVLTNDVLAEQLSKPYDLPTRYGTKGRSATYRTLHSHVRILVDQKDGFLDVVVTDQDPAFATSLANGFGNQLKSNLYEMRLLDISQARYAMQLRYDLAAKSFLAVQKKLQTPDFQGVIQNMSASDRYGIISLAGIQAETTLQQSAAALQNNIVNDLVQSQVVKMQDQLSSLQRLVVDNMHKSARQNTGLMAAAVGAFQESAYWSSLMGRLTSRIELLKKEELEQLKITPAEVPDEKSGPHRILIVLLGLGMGFFVGCLYAFVVEGIVSSKKLDMDVWQALGNEFKHRDRSSVQHGE